VPIRVPHKFSNPFDEEAVFINTITPGVSTSRDELVLHIRSLAKNCTQFFVRYFEYLEEMIGDGKTLTKEVNMEALKRFATVPLTDDMVKQFEDVFGDLPDKVNGA